MEYDVTLTTHVCIRGLKDGERIKLSEPKHLQVTFPPNHIYYLHHIGGDRHLFAVLVYNGLSGDDIVKRLITSYSGGA